MSITEEELKDYLIAEYSTLSLPQKWHALQRYYERLRTIHNAVGDVYKHEITVQQFAAEYPVVASKIQPELSPYIIGGYLTEEGWNIFKEQMFEPRHAVAIHFFVLLKNQLRNTVSLKDVDF